MKSCKDSGGWSNSADHAAAGYMIPVKTELLCVATGQAGADMGADMAPTLNCNHEAPYIAGVRPTLRAGGNKTGGDRPPGTDVDTCDSLVVTHSLRGEGFDASEDGTGRGTPLVPVAIPIDTQNMTEGHASGGKGFGEAGDPSFTLTKGHSHAVAATTYTLAILGRGDSHNLEYRTDGTANALLTPNGGRGGIGVGAVAFAQNQRDEVRTMDVAGALAAEPEAKQQTYVAFSAQDNGRDATDSGLTPTMRKGGDGGGVQLAVAFMETMSASTPDIERSQTLQAKNKGAVMTAMQVRRLTPRECERLQGFPDDYTLIPLRNKKPSDVIKFSADGPRYKALGNSWAVPCARWIGERIEAVEAIHAQQRKTA